MTSSVERNKKYRKSSDSDSSESRSRDRSRDRKKKKKEKKRRRSKEKEEKYRRKKSKSSKKNSKRKEKKDRSKSRSSTKKSESDGKDKYSKLPQLIPAMDPQMMGQMGQYIYPPYMMAPRDPRMVRPPIFYPHYPAPRQNLPSLQIKESPLVEQPTDKIVKDQNFLNSDEKLFESIINCETHIKTLFDDTQISESYAGPTLFKNLKKILYDPQTNIFDSDRESKREIFSLSQSELISHQIDNYLISQGYNKLSIDLGDLSSFKDEIIKLRNKQDIVKDETNQINNIS